MILINIVSALIMFAHLFNTYETVTPPDFIKDPYKEFYEKDSYKSTIINPFELAINSELPNVTPPSDDSYSPDEQFINAEITDSLEYPTNNQLVNNIINTGRSFVGHKYLYGGTSPDTGFDCSGFLQYIFKLNGIDIPRDTNGIFKFGQEVSLSNILPGDIICSKGSGSTGRHVQLVSKVDTKNNKIYVIEAKNKKSGITESLFNKSFSDIISIRRVINLNPSDPFLNNLDIKSPTTSNGKFSNDSDFIISLNAGFRKILSNKGLDPNYSYVLTAQAALESGWGKRLAGNFNYGGIKITDSLAKAHPEKVSRVLTTDYVKGKGKIRRYLNFRKFSSVEDYCNYKVNLLSNDRYNAFNQVRSNYPYEFIFHILSKGYGSDYGGPESRRYTNSVMKNLDKVLKTLNIQ